MSKEGKKIAVIGPAQSGKTCLAVGLFNTSSRDFTIETTDSDTSYLDGLKAGIGQGEWPDPTNLDTTETIRLNFCKKGKDSVAVEFIDFAGEKLDDDFFVRKNFQNLAGVVLLVNPGLDAFHLDEKEVRTKVIQAIQEEEKCTESEAERQANRLPTETMAQYQRVLKFLKDPNSHCDKAFVALTITASDRIDVGGDLVDNKKLSRFKDTVTKIANSLNTNGFRWRQFYVTVTGHLEEQTKPQFGAITNEYYGSSLLKSMFRRLKHCFCREKISVVGAAEPFLWILDELKWRPLRKAIWKKICLGCVVASVVAIGAIGWCFVDASNEKDEIDRYADACRNAVEACRGNSKPRDRDLDDARVNLDRIREYKCKWKKEYATQCADELDAAVWSVHKRAIDRAISEIAEKPESLGAPVNCKRVDELFDAFRPASGEVIAAREADKKDWVRKRAEYQERFSIVELLEGIRKPMKDCEKHGLEFIRFARELYGKLSKTSPNQPKAIAAKDKLSKELDARVEKEWRSAAIRDFTDKASGEATHEATHDFAALLYGWNPATTNGAVVKMELMSVVSNSIPKWRAAYEEKQFSGRMEKAITDQSLEELAKFYPNRVTTNEFLTEAFVEAQWEKRGRSAYDKVYTDYLNSVVAKTSNSKTRNVLADADKKEIEDKAIAVGMPFDAKEALSYVNEHIESKAQEWNSAERAECKKWITDKIRDGRSRTDSNGLWSEYVTECRHTSNPFFVEIVGAVVYKEVEKWFESDIAAFKAEFAPENGVSIWQDNGNFKVRYKRLSETFEEFKKTCQRVGADKNPPVGTWAHRFAELCCKNDIDKGVNKAFRRSIVVKKLDAMIDDQKDLPKLYQCTAFAAWVNVESFESDGTPAKGDNDSSSGPTNAAVLIPADGPCISRKVCYPERGCGKREDNLGR